MSKKVAPQLRILSQSSSPFVDRVQAGRLLAVELSKYIGQETVVLGIPRGGMVIAREIAIFLDAELDIVLAHKLRTPGHQELAIGSVTEEGQLFINREVTEMIGIGENYIQREKALQMAEIKRRTSLFRHFRPKVPLEGKIVIVTDDGVATGATTQAAFWAIRLERPRKLVAAIPVGSMDAIKRLSLDVDELLCLRTPPNFSAVGQFYRQFYQVEDEDVIEILQERLKVSDRDKRS